MKRKAILIESSNVKGQKEIPGARVDVKSWLNFLKSDLGGAWSESEIVVFSKPSPATVTRELPVDSDCYCFVAFSGHGSDGTVVLSDDCADFPIESLKPKGRQGTLIVDSCRGVEREPYGPSGQAVANELLNRSTVRDARAAQFSSAVEASESLNLKRSGKIITHRQIWDEELKKCGVGVVEMLACAKGQAAGEDPSAGGYYTSLLLESADSWKRTATTSAHTTKDAHDYAAAKLPEQQTPEYRPLGLAFPFAVDDTNIEEGDSQSAFVITGRNPTQAVHKSGGGRFG